MKLYMNDVLIIYCVVLIVFIVKKILKNDWKEEE